MWMPQTQFDKVKAIIEDFEGIPPHEQCLSVADKQIMDDHKLSDFNLQIDMLIMYQNVKGQTWKTIRKDPLQWLQDSLGGRHWSHAEVFAQDFDNRRAKPWKLIDSATWRNRPHLVDGFLYRITPMRLPYMVKVTARMMQDAERLGFMVVRSCPLQLDLRQVQRTHRKRRHSTSRQ